MFVHWAHFTKPYGINTCLSFAKDAMTRQGYKMIDDASDGDYVVIGSNDNVIAHAVCVPEGAGCWVGVSVYSTDSNAALLARNKIREQIERTVLID
jgi:hypothetical protein